MLRLKKKRFIKKLTFLFLIPLFICASVAALFYIPYFRIKKISIEGNSSLDQEKIIAEISNYLKDKQFKIFPRDNILILPKEKINRDLLTKFPRIKTVSLNRGFPNALSVVIKERNNEAIFCPEGEGGCFFIDEDGVVFEPASYFSAGVYLSFLDERGEKEAVEINENIISEEQFKKIIDFKNLLAKEDIKILQVILKKERIYQLQTDEGWFILLNEKNDAQLTYQNLKTTLDQIKEKRKNLDYIDLRFGNKVFYKFK